MDSFPRQKLCELVTPSSHEILENPRRLEGLLRDYCAAYKREVNVLVSACKEHIPQELLAADNSLPHEILMTRLVNRLVDDLAISVDAAGWAVESWALALGVIAEPLLVGEGENTTDPKMTVSQHLRFNLSLRLAAGVTLKLVRIPAGEFLMGSNHQRDEHAWQDEMPQHHLYLNEYLMGKTPLTVAQFAFFVQASGYRAELFKHSPSKGNHPVTRVSWEDAMAFCAWASQATGRKVRLPNEAEWEKAARGQDGRLWPWSDQVPDSTLCNSDSQVMGTTAVGKYSPQGDSPFGCVDMAGNVWEWTSSILGDYPYQVSDGREDVTSRRPRILRGGSFNDSQAKTRCACRHWDLPELRSAYQGFRVAVSI